MYYHCIGDPSPATVEFNAPQRYELDVGRGRDKLIVKSTDASSGVVFVDSGQQLPVQAVADGQTVVFGPVAQRTIVTVQASVGRLQVD